MRIEMVGLGLLCLSYAAGAGELKAPSFTLETAHTAQGFEIKAVPPEGHHFNVKAPMKAVFGAEKFTPGKASERQIEFSIPGARLPAASVQGTASLYLCDDPNTFCERHEVSVTWNPSAPLQKKEPVTMKSAEPEAKSPSKKKLPESGKFILNDAKTALAQALREGKPLLIDFFAIWCPPCNQLDAEVFSSGEFGKSASRFVRLKLDADDEASWELKSRYKVSGYPTVLFASSSGDEIQRVVGYPGKAVFLKELERAWTLRESPVSALRQAASLGDAGASERLGLLAVERGEYETAIGYLARVPARREELLSARVGALEEKSAGEAELVPAMENVIREFPESLSALEYRLKWADLLKDRGDAAVKRQGLLKEAAAVSEKLLKDKRPLTRGYQEGDVLQVLAETQAELGDAEAARKTWQRAARGYAAKARSLADRGPLLEQAYCLWKSGDFEGAEKTYRKLQGKYPKEFTFFYAEAVMNLERKAPEALRSAQSAFEYSYGDNRLRAAHLLARALRQERKNREALQVVERVLTEAKRPADGTIRTTRYLGLLEKLRTELTTRVSD